MAGRSKAERAAIESTHESRKRKETALADIREMQRDQKRGELLERAAVLAKWSEALARIRERVLSVPDRIADELANQPAPAVRGTLAAALEDALRDCVKKAS